MATIKIAFDKRQSNITVDGKYPLVLRIGHKSKTRDVPFNLHLKHDQYDPLTGKITGIQHATRHTKRVRKIFSDTDLWVDENTGEIKNWDMDRLKRTIEQQFFAKMPSRSILNYGAVYLGRLKKEGRYSTSDSYEDALKALVKFRKHQKRHDDKVAIKTLFTIDKGGLKPLDDYDAYDMEMKSMDYSFLKDFKAYMSKRFKSRNTPAIYLRSLQAIMNDAGKAYPELADHKPLSKIKKQSIENVPEPLALEDINRIRALDLKEGSPIWHNRNYLLIMFNNMGMNFFDVTTVKRHQFTDNRIKYFRKKTRTEGDYFSILQRDEALSIIEYYLAKGGDKNDYLFPIIPNDTPPEKLHLVNNAKVKTFNKYAKRMAEQAGITKKITTYTLRDTWTNIGLDMGIDIRKISSGLGHSSVQVTEKHYGKNVTEKILDDVNALITSNEGGKKLNKK